MEDEVDATMPGVVGVITEELQVASCPCIVDAMICYVCFRSPHHERNRFPEDVENPASIYCDSTPDDRPLLALSEKQHIHLQECQPA